MTKSRHGLNARTRVTGPLGHPSHLFAAVVVEAPIVQADPALGRVRLRSTADATVEVPPAPTPLLPAKGHVANAPEPARLGSRVITSPPASIEAQAAGRVRVRGTVTATNVVQAAAQGRVRARSTATGESVPVPYRALKSRANQPRPARLGSRIPTATFPEAGVVLGQAVGQVRVRGTAAASVVQVAAAQGRVRVRSTTTGEVVLVSYGPIRNEANQPTPARLRSRITTTLAVVEAQAVGRVRVRATADGSAIPQAMRPLRARVPNVPKSARLRTRIQDVRPPAGVVNGDAIARVRVRSTASAAVVELAVGTGRVRVRSTAAGTRITLGTGTGRVRVRATAVATRVTLAVGQGRVRVRGKAVATNIITGTAAGRARVRSSVTALNVAQSAGKGRVRLRSTAVGDFFGANFVFANASGRVRVRSSSTGTAYDWNPRWPNTNDPDEWPQTSAARWPQTNDPDNWPG